MSLSHVKRIVVVRAGMTGHGIAQEFALAGYEVRVQDLSEGKLL